MNREQMTVKLSDGREFKLQELNGMEVMIASKIAKDDVTAMAAASVAYSIAEVNGEKFKRPVTLAEVQAFMSGIKAKDFARLGRAYGILNGDEAAGEAAAAE